MVGVSYHAVLRAIDRGDLEAERLFNRLRITEDALGAYRETNRVTPRAERAALHAPSPHHRRSTPAVSAGSLAALRSIERNP
jgi:hypothetical protein